jgi:hypothetical protein
MEALERGWDLGEETNSASEKRNWSSEWDDIWSGSSILMYPLLVIVYTYNGSAVVIGLLELYLELK